MARLESASSQLPRHIAALLSPDAYPHSVDGVDLVQTHISYVFLAGDFVYKVKKPVNLGFLDFSTLEKRRRFCHEEVRLNRRLCSGTYLDVVPIAYVEGEVRVDAAGAAVDYAVKMRRLPEEGMMTRLLERGEVDTDRLRALATRLAQFHASSDTSEYIASFGELETIGGNWGENFEQTGPYIGRTITRRQFDRISAYVGDFLRREAPLLRERVVEGRVRDCHGDLRAEAVCFSDGLCVFDCIEFNERFRYSDVASDLAFLAMDLEYRGHRALSDELVGLYLGVSGDSTLPLVLDFYKCYRAYVRGKVDGFQVDQPEVPAAQRRQARDRARAYFRLADSYVGGRRGRPALTCIMGLTGTGKSHLANALAARLGAVVISSDVVRKRLAGIERTERRLEHWAQGIYSPDFTERAYETMLKEAHGLLAAGRTVVLDASYLMRRHREAAARLAREMRSRFLVVECRLDESLLRQRLAARSEDPWTASDGRWEIYARQKERREPVDEVPSGRYVAVDTAWPLGEQLDIIDAWLARSRERAG